MHDKTPTQTNAQVFKRAYIADLQCFRLNMGGGRENIIEGHLTADYPTPYI